METRGFRPSFITSTAAPLSGDLRRIFNGLVKVVQLQMTRGPIGIERWNSGVQSDGQTIGIHRSQVVFPQETFAGEKAGTGVPPVQTQVTYSQTGT